MEPTSLTDATEPDELAQVLLEVAPVGMMLLRPVFAAEGGDIIDVVFEYLNPIAQRKVLLPARPTESLRTLYPDDEGLFAFYQKAYLSGGRAEYEGTREVADLVFTYRLVAQRQGPRLVVSFETTTNHPIEAVAEQLHASLTREQAARQLAERQQQEVTRLFEQAPVAISVLKGPRHVVELMNEANATLLGSTREKLLGQPIMEALPELQGQGFDLVLHRVMQGETIVFREVSVELSRANIGKPDSGYYHVTYQPWRAENGAIVGAIAVAIEVTDQVLARQQLELLNQELEARVQDRTRQAHLARAEAERERGRLAQLIAEAPAAICVLAGPKFVYEFVNPRYQALFDNRTLVGRSILDAVPEYADQPVWHGLRGVYKTGRTHLADSKAVPVARPDGVVEERYFTYIEQARHNEHGEIDGVYVFGFEVTDKVLAHEQVRRLNDKLTAANQELCAANKQLMRTNIDLDNFIYTASHDLKAPITNIEGLLNLLKKSLPAEVRTDGLVATVLSRMHGSVERFTRTIGHLTDVTKLQIEFAHPPETLSLAAVLEDVRQDLLPQLTEAGAELEVDVDDCQPRVFSEKNLRSILYNLLSNALKYRHPARPPRIRMACAPEGDELVLQVQDNGLGVGDWQQARLFQLFQRLHTHVEGSGLGLYMVKKIVENAGGTITVESQVDVGTTFILRFPA
ncbi:ATP-binding protein [Hymenobacter sp. BT559]|uniref:sensor histidine kinase n=1 Tax=Hymenobacter sp. BT559 TaxID=2795729 RepID=UPI0018EB6056|nr:ATP-binding protein [Hymenobacter sp. BT559]MBJ6144120.1 PAS domain-containing protein [Hymenobacter sp. BT559]